MATSKDWIADAAREIAETADIESRENIETIAAVIEQHCPFKRDVAYIEVQRRRELADEAAAVLKGVLWREADDRTRTLARVIMGLLGDDHGPAHETER